MAMEPEIKRGYNCSAMHQLSSRKERRVSTGWVSQLWFFLKNGNDRMTGFEASTLCLVRLPESNHRLQVQIE